MKFFLHPAVKIVNYIFLYSKLQIKWLIYLPNCINHYFYLLITLSEEQLANSNTAKFIHTQLNSFLSEYLVQ